MARLMLVLLGLFCAITAVMMIMNHGKPDFELSGALAESFYYTAIAFAVYHIYNKRKQNNA